MGAAILIEQPYRAQGMELEDQAIGTLLSKRDETAFEQVFKTHFKRLHAYAFTILRDEMEAEEMVQQVFFKLWERNENLSLTGSVSAYLYRAVHNESLNYIKHQKVRSNHQLHIAYSMKNEVEHPAKEILSGELEKKIHSALNELPEQCRTIFQMSRFDELKYREIADKLGISVKTVENQMGKALKLLREKLVDFLVFILLFSHF
ncbi:MAG TPA: RNA polymerase sigma-70 factor [Chitinophagaceae bacterium]|nr:RNA polymerase sigma-70 factor [Chitinophagaceae bacterium]